MSTSSRTILITGATGGIGRAIAERLAQDSQLYLTGRDPQRLQQAAQLLPSAVAIAANLASPGDLHRVASTVGDVDVLIHSAGVLHMGSVEELTPDQWHESLEANLLAPAALTQALLPSLRRRHGHVVFLNSGLGHRAIAGSAAYSASKFALTALADALRLEEAVHGVRVTSVHPGRVSTPMQQALREWERRSYDGEEWIRPEQIAETVATVIGLGPGANIDTVNINPARSAKA